jgi:hypothetical protein
MLGTPLSAYPTSQLLQELVKRNVITLAQSRALRNAYRKPGGDDRMTPQNPEETSTWANL